MFDDDNMRLNECFQCDCYDEDFCCTMSSYDKVYACPLNYNHNLCIHESKCSLQNKKQQNTQK